MRATTGTTDGTVYTSNEELEVAFASRVPSSTISTVVYENASENTVVDGVRAINFDGREVEFAQLNNIIYGDRSIYYRQFTSEGWTPWLWTGYNAQYGADKWDIAIYRSNIALMLIKNNLDLVVVTTQNLENWQESFVLSTNTQLCTMCAYKDQLHYIFFDGAYKIGKTDLLTQSSVAYTPVNYGQISMFVAFSQIVIIDAYTTPTYAQFYDGTAFSAWANLGILTVSYVTHAQINGQIWIIYNDNATNLIKVAKLSNLLVLSSTTVVSFTPSFSGLNTIFVYGRQAYIGYLNPNGFYVYNIVATLAFPNLGTMRQVEAAYTQQLNDVVVQSTYQLNELLKLYVSDYRILYRYIVNKQVKTLSGYYYELTLWNFVGDNENLLLKQMKTPTRRVIKSQ